MQLFAQLFFLCFVGLSCYELWKSWYRHKTWIKVAGVVDSSHTVAGGANGAPPTDGNLHKIRVSFYDTEGQKRAFVSYQTFGHRFLTFGKEWPAGYALTVQYQEGQWSSARIATPWLDVFQASFIFVMGAFLAFIASISMP